VIQVDEGGQASYVVTGAEVLAVDRPDGGVIGAAASSSSLTVAVDAKQALRLAAAIRSQRLEVVRSTGASESGAATGASDGTATGAAGREGQGTGP
jgi:hypothetical protein